MNGTITVGTILIFISVLSIAGSWFLPLLIGGLVLVAVGAFVLPAKPAKARTSPTDDDRFV
jgi:hypothetical protein